MDFQLLALAQVNIFTFVGHHPGGSDSGADGRAYRSSLTAARYGANHRANSGCGPDLGDVASGCAFAAHSAFGIDIADALPAVGVNDFDYLRAQMGPAVIGQANLFKRKMQLGSSL